MSGADSRSLEAAPYDPAVQMKVVGFAHLLRHHGFQLGWPETEDAFQVAEYFLFRNFPAFRYGLRSLVCQSERDYPAFERLFAGYWCPADATERIVAPRKRSAKPDPPEIGRTEMSVGLSEEAEIQESSQTRAGASSIDVLGLLDLSQVTPTDQALLERVARRLWQRMRLDLPRRLRGHDWKDRLHFRRTMRRNISQGGDPVQLVFGGRKPRKPRLVVMLDISGSMELYSFTFLRLLYALQREFRRIHSFVFSTALEEVTPLLAARSIEGALAALSRRRIGWNGGTRIGDSLYTLIEEHGGRVLRPDSVFVILSDGLDTGEPDRLVQGLRAIRTRTRKVIWLNPLLGIEGYEPLAQGMQAALPLIDVFAPAHNLESLLDIERFLVK